MKLSFSLPSKFSSKSYLQKRSHNFSQEDTSKDDRETNHEFVTEFVPSQTLTSPEKRPKHVIPRLENTWNPYKKMRNLDLPIRSSGDDTDLRFETEAPSAIADADSTISYGLNLRVREEIGEDGGEKLSDVSDRSEQPASIENLMLQKFRDEMKVLPDEQGLEEFEDVPVEGFGAALLGAYGWKEGKGIGRNAKEDVKVVQYVRRAGREGLGFEPEMRDDSEKKGQDSGRGQLVAAKGSDGRTRHVVGIDEKLVRRELRGIHVGKSFRIVGGRHVGLKGKVVEKLGGDEVVLKLSRSGEEVTVVVDEVAELGSVEEEKCLKNLRQLKIQDESKNDKRRNERRNSSTHNDTESKDSGRDEKRKEQKRNRDEGGRFEKGKHDNGGAAYEENNRSWLRSHIRVRIIGKDFKGGRLYLKKGKVIDVVGPRICDISMDGSEELIQGVHQDILETALPRRGGPILVLFGKHKGVFGNLMERDMEKETGVVRVADSHELINVRLEQISEYVGDPSYIGY